MKKKLHWLWALLIQSAAMLLLSLIGALTLYLGSTLHAIVQWAILPIAGCASAYIATILGLNNYIAWIAPPAMGFAAHLIAWGFVPSPGPILLCALISLIGAAAGEVVKRQNNAKK